MNLLRGEPIAKAILDKASRDAKRLHAQGVTPTLAAILVGDDPSSQLYVSLKKKIAKKLGIDFLLYQFGGSARPVEIEQLLITLHMDETVHGIMVQLPLPVQFDVDKITKFLDPGKDVDGLLDGSKFMAPAPQAVIEILNYYELTIQGARIGIFGKGRLIGKPLRQLLTKMGAKVVMFDVGSSDTANRAKECEILVSATGRAHTIKPSFVKPEHVLIDAGGAYSIKKNKTIGDYSNYVRNLANASTPRLGGVGPVTVANLMRNIIDATLAESR